MMFWWLEKAIFQKVPVCIMTVASHASQSSKIQPGGAFQAATAAISSREPDNIEHPPEIVGERGQAELGPDLLQATHQKRPLVHPLFDRAKRMFDRLASAVENTRDASPSRACHPVQHRFVLKPRYRAKLAARALRADLAIIARQLVDVVDLLQSTQKRR